MLNCDGKYYINMKNITLREMDTFYKRFKGLMFKTSMNKEGYLFRNCKSIHTCFMKFPIDVVGIDENFQVMEIHSKIVPWKFVWMRKDVKHIIEMKTDAFSINIGDVISEG
ncbi:MAG: DUF192 domain-containing protein [Clostridia bacterium]|nr:DUF192 domain-containing protein [Clostridia bacterium]